MVSTDSSSYSFRDLGSRIEVQLEVDPGCSSSDIVLNTTADSLQVTNRATAAVLLDIFQLYSTVAADSSRQTLSGGNLRITLQKLDESLDWPGLEAQSQAESGARARGDQTSQALAERDKVKALLTAAQSGTVAEVQAAAEHFSGSSVAEVKDGTGKNSLHFAAQLGQVEVCHYLLTEQAFDPNTQEEAGETALTLAAGSGEEQTVALLLKHNAEISKSRPGGAQPIHTAAASGSVATLKLLLEHGADANADCDAGPPILWAGGSGKAASVEALIAAGADPNTAGNSDVTAVLAASAAGNVACVQALLAGHAEPSIPAEHGVTALHAAAELGNLQLVNLLLQAGANPDAEDGGGQKPIHAAAAEQHREVVEVLLPLTKPDADNASNWTVDGIIEEAQQSIAVDQPQVHQHQVQIPAPQQPDEDAAAEHKRKGDVAFVAKQYQEALQAYNESLKHSTSNHVVWANRSAVFLRLNKPQAALQDARRSRTLDQTYTKAWFREGSAAKELELYEDAAQAFFEAYRLDSTNPQLAQAFQEAIKLGQKQHQQRQQQQH